MCMEVNANGKLYMLDKQIIEQKLCKKSGSPNKHDFVLRLASNKI